MARDDPRLTSSSSRGGMQVDRGGEFPRVASGQTARSFIVAHDELSDYGVIDRFSCSKYLICLDKEFFHESFCI